MVLPYLKGLVIILCRFFYIALWIYLYSVFVVIILLDLFRFLTIGIRALSLAKEGKICFLFAEFVFREEKEGDALQVQI
jgi:hypothetical protein